MSRYNIMNYIKNHLKLLLVVFVALSIFILPSFSQQGQTITQQLCSIYNSIHGAVFILALALITLGGLLYAIAHVMPPNQRGSIQGYAFGMIMGGLVGVIIVLLAPFLISHLAAGAPGSITGSGGGTVTNPSGVSSICSSSGSGTFLTILAFPLSNIS